MVNGQSQSEWCWAIKVKLLILWASFRLANHGKTWQIPQVPLSVLPIAVDCRREVTAPREYILETQEERLVQRPKHIFLNSVLVSILNVFQEYVHVLPALIVFEELVPAGCPEPRLTNLSRRHFFLTRHTNETSQMLHVWNIYLQNWAIFGVNVGVYSIHGASGLYYTLLTRASDNIDSCTKPSCTWTFSLRKFMLIGRNRKYWTRVYLPWC